MKRCSYCTQIVVIFSKIVDILVLKSPPEIITKLQVLDKFSLHRYNLAPKISSTKSTFLQIPRIQLMPSSWTMTKFQNNIYHPLRAAAAAIQMILKSQLMYLRKEAAWCWLYCGGRVRSFCYQSSDFFCNQWWTRRWWCRCCGGAKEWSIAYQLCRYWRKNGKSFFWISIYL